MNIAILLSGGAGLRVGADIPKQYIRVLGRMLVTYCLETLLIHPLIDTVQIVAEDEWRESILADAKENGLDIKKINGFSLPGAERQSSVFNALEDLRRSFAEYGDFEGSAVLIHDAARPNLAGEQILSCLCALKGHDGVMPVLPMKDTVYLSEDGVRISSLLDRGKVFAGQAPEVFDFEKYYAAHLLLQPDRMQEVKGSTEPAVMAGMDVAMIPGDENNFKVTTKSDLERFRKQKEADGK
ncbi:MAG: 2-C-methyl-D-erythritol 4-phosphate cytidylyltransferase [Dorea sp.]|nr:2-C-methyl-D-erythritol 4-phosphate cytidylyltransferase [Dorea sp.]